MAPTPDLAGRSPAQSALDWLRDRWQQSQGQVPGGPPRIGNVSVPGPGQGIPAPEPGAAPTEPAPPAPAPVERRPREAPPPDRPFAAPKDQLEELTNRLWEIEWAQYEAEQEAADTSKLPSDVQAAANRATALGNQWATISGQIAQERQRVQTDTEQAAQRERQAEQDRLTREAKPARGTPLPAVRKTYTPPGGTPVSAWVPQIADGNGGSQDDPDGTPTRDTSLIGEALSGGETGAAQRQTELATAQLKLKLAEREFAEATSPEAKERARLELDTARLKLTQAQRELDKPEKPSETTVDGYLVRVTPSGELTRIDTLTPQQRAQQDEVTRLELEKARQGPTFTDATAAYNAQVPRLQQAARQERDRLLELQRSGAISEADAERQFTTWFGQNVEAPLAGYRTAAEEAQRKERLEQEALQRAENVRAENANRARETAGYTAGENARTTWMGLAPQVRTPQFLQQAGQSVANMSARANAPTTAAAAALPRGGSTFTADTFNPANFAGAIPNLDEVARAATQRALSTISPAVAAQINAPMPQLPTGPTLQGMLQQLPYRGPLSQLPLPSSGLLPTPGMDQAQDIGGGMARTPYGPGGNVWLEWALPQG
jgi:hypothetical protein